MPQDHITVDIVAPPQVSDYISWRLWDPFILAVGIPHIAIAESSEDLVTQNPTPKLLILGGRPGDLKSLDASLSHAGEAAGLIAVQPALLGMPLSDDLAKRCGVRFQGWKHETPPFSIVSEHPIAQLLGRSAGRTVVPHLPYEWHMELEVTEAEAVTWIQSGSPDLVVCDRSALIATNLFSELLAHFRHPEYRQYEADATGLLINLVRTALGADPASVPPSNQYSYWRFHFYGYGFARQFITELMVLEAERIDPDTLLSLNQRLDRADDLIARSANSLLGSDVTPMRSFYREAASLLLECRKTLTPVEPYFVRGWHGGILSDRVIDGELVGYAEWGWPSYTMRWLEDRLLSAERWGCRQINEVPGQTWDIIADHTLTDLQRWRKVSQEGLIESVKGMYSDGYLEILGTESNIRQFEFGLKAITRMGGQVRTFMCAYDDYAFHPQLPQILRGFGFEFAVLRCGGPGEIKQIDCETFLWEGLDGTRIPAVPTYESVPTPTLHGPQGGVRRMAEILVRSEESGLHTVLVGGSQDATVDLHGEHEFETLNSLIPVQAAPGTYPEYFKRATLCPSAVFLGVDDLLGRPDFWSGFGSINAYCREDRRIERLLVAAEGFSVLAATQGRPYPAKSFEQAWKALLSHQDHFAYGCGGPDNPEGYHVGGLMEPHIPGYPGPKTRVTCDATTLAWRESAKHTAETELDGALSHLLRSAVSSGESNCLHLAVFNLLNWDRHGEVRVWLPIPAGAQDIAITDGKQRYPATILARRNNGEIEEGLASFWGSMPSFGFGAYTVDFGTTLPSDGLEDDTPTRLENPYILIELCPETGSIIRFLDKARNRELIRGGEAVRYTCSLPEIDSTTSQAELSVRRLDSVAKSIAISGHLGGYPYTCTLTLFSEAPWLEIDLEVDYQEGAIFGFKGSPQTLLRAVFPFSVVGDRWVNQPFGVYRTTSDYQVALDFVDTADATSGIAVMNDGVPGVRLKDGNVELLISDGFPSLRGVHHYRYAIYPHRGNWREGDVLRRAHEFQQQLVPTMISDGDPPLPFQRSYLRVTDGVVLSGLHMANDSIVARFYASDGESRNVETHWGFAWKEAFATRLDGRDQHSLAVDGDRLQFDVEPWRIATITGTVEQMAQWQTARDQSGTR